MGNTNVEINEIDTDWYEFMEYDRKAVINSALWDKQDDCYISFSGGKDSTVLHYLVDMALPGNKIPRVFINTGIEYNDIVKFVKDLAKNDDRFIIINPTKNIKTTLESYGYPFKSKQHSHNLSIYQHTKVDDLDDVDSLIINRKKITEHTVDQYGLPLTYSYYEYRNKNTNRPIKIPLTLIRYLGIEKTTTQFRCPKKLLYQFRKDFNIKISDKCCFKLKKEPIHKWQKENNKTISILGLKMDEGGQRASHKGCIVYDKDKNITKFKPLNPITNEWEDWFIKKHNIKLCKLYYPPFNFKRTGCRGCPFSLDLQNQLDVMAKLLPNEQKQCEIIWKPIYKEYRRIGYRLRKYTQMNLYDFIDNHDDN